MTPIRYTMAEAMTAVERRIEDLGRAASFRDLVADCENGSRSSSGSSRSSSCTVTAGWSWCRATFGEIRVEWQG